MMYRFMYDGVELWRPGVKDIFSPELEVELNTAGRFSFTMTPDHPNYHLIRPLIGTVEVYENSELIWFGRAISLQRNMKNHKTCYCEGAIAYFNDSVQAPRELDSVTAETVLGQIVAVHNQTVPENRQFQIGTVEMPDATHPWTNDYDNSINLVTKLLEDFGGYLIPRRKAGVNFLDYYYELPRCEDQSVEYGSNMLNFQRDWSFEEKYTAILPLGDAAEGGDEPVHIAGLNNGNLVLDGPEVGVYGRIIKVVKFPNVNTPSALLAAAQEYMNKVEFDPISVDIGAAELSFVDARCSPFRVGRQYHVVSEKHELDMWLPITRLQIPLDKGSREITLGTVKKPGAAETYLRTLEEMNTVKQSLGPYVGGGEWSGAMANGKWVGTQEQYDALVDNGRERPGVAYYIVPGTEEALEE